MIVTNVSNGKIGYHILGCIASLLITGINRARACVWVFKENYKFESCAT
jgi:hypothetical protein